MPLWKKMLFITASTTIVRMKYYHAWLIADSICNASGLGFNGYSSDGEPEWDLTSNVDILKFEASSSRSNGRQQRVLTTILLLHNSSAWVWGTASSNGTSLRIVGCASSSTSGRPRTGRSLPTLCLPWVEPSLFEFCFVCNVICTDFYSDLTFFR